MKKQDSEIIIEILSDTTAVPNVLLENFREFKLSEKDTLFLIALLHRYGQKKSMSIESITEEMYFSEEQTGKVLAKLVDKGFVCVKEGEVSLYCLYDKLREAWGWREAKAIRLIAEKKQNEAAETEDNRDFAILFHKIESEFGRPLSPIEIETVKDWYFTMNMPSELIYEALKRAVLNNKRSFQYIRKILLDWQGKGYRCILDLEQESKPVNKKGKEPENKRKYRKNQDVDIFEDLFEVE